MNEFGQVHSVVGTGRGDEAKARWVVELLESGLFTTTVRFGGADNAGHTSDIDGAEINLHQVPMGILFPGVRNLITKASFVNPTSLLDEVDYLRSRGLDVNEKSLGISDVAHLILPGHITLDNLREKSDDKQGATGKGISFVAADKGERIGVRVEDLFTDSDRIEDAVMRSIKKANKALKAIGKPEDNAKEVWENWYKKAKEIACYVVDTTVEVRDILNNGEQILAEGAQAFGLDIDHGTYPYVTSSNPGTSGVMNSLGIGPKSIGKVYGAAKAIPSSVGAPQSTLPTLMPEELVDQIRGDAGLIDSERGKSTGRPRDLMWMDIPALYSAIEEYGIDEIFMAKLDWVPRVGTTTLIAESYNYQGKITQIAPSDSAEKLKKVTANYIDLPTWSEPIGHIRRYNDLPVNARRWIETVQNLLPISITKIGVGPLRGQVINIGKQGL